MNNELLTVLEYMEKERGLEREDLIQVVESAILSATRKSVVQASDIRISIDRKTYDIKAYAKLRVVDRVIDKHNEILLDEARQLYKDAKSGDIIEKEVTPPNFGRIAAQTARQAILHRLRAVEKEKVYDEFKDRIGNIISGTVIRFDRSDIVVDLGRAEGVIPMRERVTTEEYSPGDHIRAYVLKVDNVSQNANIILSRSHPDFVRKLFELEVSEIADGTVKIKAVAREAGFRTKIAVFSEDEKVDPVGACVGLRGTRVKNIVRELSGEKIDIIRWSNDIRTFITNALAPAKLLKIEEDYDFKTVHVTVNKDQLSLAIGKKGQNARLTARLTGWKIDIRKEEVDMGFEEKVASSVANLAKVDGIGEAYAEKLVHSGFLTLEGILAADLTDLESVEGFDERIALTIQEAAEKAYEKENGPIE